MATQKGKGRHQIVTLVRQKGKERHRIVTLAVLQNHQATGSLDQELWGGQLSL